jgi:hypothetical protein
MTRGNISMFAITGWWPNIDYLFATNLRLPMWEVGASESV